MNREERRTLEREIKKLTKNTGLTDNQIKGYIKFKDWQSKSTSLKEGDKVKLNYEVIVNDINYKTKTIKYKNFIEENKETVFTVEYDQKYKKNPWLVCLKEDITQPKWLFIANDLIKI